MDQATRTRIEHNIFRAAYQACEPWEKFPWHRGVYAVHSSQALAIDVFGTIKKLSTSRHHYRCYRSDYWTSNWGALDYYIGMDLP